MSFEYVAAQGVGEDTCDVGYTYMASKKPKGVKIKL